MNLQKALQILGLTEGFTEAELKKAYRKLITKYHPDKYETKTKEERKYAEARAKEINAAKEYLSNYLKQNSAPNTPHQRTNTKNNQYTYSQFSQEKEKLRKIVNNMKREITIIFDASTDNLLLIAVKEILQCIKTTEQQLERINTEFSYKIVALNYYETINSILEKFKKEYCKKYNITIGNTKLERYSIKKLYIQLEHLKTKQNAFSVEEILNQEISKYSGYAGYSVIKDLIENIKIQLIQKNSNVRDSKETIINEFNSRVLKEFEAFYQRLKTIDQFQKMNLTGIKLETLLKALIKNIDNPDKFKYYEIQLINTIAEMAGHNIKIANNNKNSNSYIYIKKY